MIVVSAAPNVSGVAPTPPRSTAQSYDVGTLYIAPSRPALEANGVDQNAAEARLVQTMSLDRKAKRVDAAAHAILAKFPPGGAR